ncbi:8863_t:CDS:2 [Paraglomus brasilianum]|uniref:8863_t:CDS:1 n=1 Tax=Paraglomus brasilianum TaxID=144538 RepID=A0A9N9BRX0_9GLOM|nr:8863_t:CDS:2 [Paraglomus brasilianum]
MTSELTLYKRPGYGDEGRTGSRDRQTKILANMFEIETKDMTFHQYVIEIRRYTSAGVPATLVTIGSSGRKHGRHIFAAFHKKNKEVYFSGVEGVAFDGDSSLFTTGKLTLDSNNQISQPVEVENDGKYYVKIRENTDKPTISMDDLKGVLTGDTFESGLFNNRMLNALGAFLQYNPCLKLIQFFGNYFYVPETIRLLGKGAAMLQGYGLHVRPGEGDGRGRKLFLNVNVTYTPIVEPIDLCKLICKFLDTQTLPNLFRRDITSRLNRAFQHNFRYVKFKLLHRPESQVEMTIERLSDLPAAEIMFVNPELGREESMKDYFARKHNINLTTPYVAEGRRLKCPIECLSVVEGQRYYNCKQLNSNQRAEISRITSKRPAENVQFMLNSVRDVLSFSDELLQHAGIRLNTQMANVPGRFINIPEVSYSASSKHCAQVKPKDWDATWNLRDVKYLHPGDTLKEWIAISLTQAVSPDNINTFMNDLVRQARTQGMDITGDFMPPKYIQWQVEQARDEIVNAVEDAKKAAKNLQLVVFFIDHGKHHMNKKQYNLVKEVMDTHIGILSQCVQSQLVKRCNTHYLANITAKLNLKLNGTNSAVSLPRIDDQRTMVMGADVTHPPPGTTAFPTIAAVVGSIDRYAARYAERHMEQLRGDEIYDMEELTYQLLREFVRTNKGPPASIIVYRDGISESQFKPLALDKELTNIKKACARLNPEYKPKISYIVVTKRHTNRFYPIDKQDADKRGNVKPGLVVERVITHPYLFNFYLTSHSSTQGTSRPSLYYVLYDENQFEVDELQDFTNKLCYNFQRATRAVAIPAPAYYAHYAAKRARSHSLDGQFKMTKSEFAQKYPMYYV